MAVSQKNSRILVTITKELKERMEAIAKKEHRSISNLCSKILSDYFEKKEGG